MNPMYYILIGVIALVVAIDLYLKKKNKKSESTDVEKFSDNVFAKEPNKFNPLLLIGGGLIVFTIAFFLTDKFIYDGRLSDNSDGISLFQNLTFDEVLYSEISRDLNIEMFKKDDAQQDTISYNGELLTAILIDKYGNAIGVVINGLEQGIHKRYYENGQIESLKNMIDGSNHGVTRYWYENGQIRREHYYKKGTKHGPNKHWYENGQIHIDEVISNKNLGKYDKYTRGFNRVGVFKSWYENGQLEQEGRVNDYNQNDGIHNGYYENGQLKYSMFYNNGRLDGLQSFYRTNGSKSSTMNYTYSHPDEFYHGFYRYFDENDVITDEINYNMGSCISYAYFNNGEKYQVNHYLDNSEKCEEKNIDFAYWYKNGEKIQKQNFKNGKPYGKRIFY